MMFYCYPEIIVGLATLIHKCFLVWNLSVHFQSPRAVINMHRPKCLLCMQSDSPTTNQGSEMCDM